VPAVQPLEHITTDCSHYWYQLGSETDERGIVQARPDENAEGTGEILSCTSCLNYFKLRDRIKAGKMFSILEVITGADDNVLTR
jgi:hypothetical protein